MMGFVIKWHWGVGEMDWGYVKKLSSAAPYTLHVTLAKYWKTRKNAERYLSLKDAGWAKLCEIVEVDKEVKTG